MKFVVVNGRPPRQQTRWLATAVAVLTLLLAFLNAAPGEERPVAGVAPEFNKPQPDRRKLNEGKVIGGEFVVARRDLPGSGPAR